MVIFLGKAFFPFSQASQGIFLSLLHSSRIMRSSMNTNNLDNQGILKKGGFLGTVSSGEGMRDGPKILGRLECSFIRESHSSQSRL